MKLVKTKNIAPQLSNQEWIHSVPGTTDEKRILSRCVNCHSVERVVTSKYTAPELVAVMERMATYSNNSFFMKPQVRAMARDMERFAPNADKDAAYLASINLSTGERKWEPKPLPRVTGRGTRVIITEYDLPRPESQPHDVIVDKEGIVWYSDFSDQFLGRFDPKTLAIKEYPVPLHREGFPTGALDLEVDPDGNLWMALMFQAGIAKFDKKTEKMQTWQLPEGVLKEDFQQAMVGAAELDRRRQGLDDRSEPARPLPHGPEDRRNREVGALQEPAEGAALGLRHLFGQGEQCLVPRFRRRECRLHRRQDQGGDAVSDADQAFASAPWPLRRRRPAVVRRIRRRADRHVRHQDQAVQGMGTADRSSCPTTWCATRTATSGPAA